MKEQVSLSILSDLRIGQALVGFTMWVKDRKNIDVFYIEDDLFYTYYKEWLNYLEDEYSKSKKEKEE